MRADLAYQLILGGSAKPLDKLLPENYGYIESSPPPAFGREILDIARSIGELKQPSIRSEREELRLVDEYHRIGMPALQKRSGFTRFLMRCGLGALTYIMAWWKVVYLFAVVMLVRYYSGEKAKAVEADEERFRRIISNSEQYL